MLLLLLIIAYVFLKRYDGLIIYKIKLKIYYEKFIIIDLIQHL